MPWIDGIRREMAKVILGKPEVTDYLLVALLAPGHILLEDVPGVGKTMAARTLARCLNLSFHRVQFTPDLLPADITGTSVLDVRQGDLHFREGPIFAHVLLADEINRATPRTQSALLEAMEEGQVSEGGVSRPLPAPFLVLATQNPVELQGTYPLPEAQLDRFLMRIAIGYPERTVEANILERHHHGSALATVTACAAAEDVLAARAEVAAIHVSAAVRDYLVDLANHSRQDQRLALGASPRASLALYRAAQALAYLRAESFVRPDDVQTLLPLVWGHRLMLSPQQLLRGVRIEEILQDILSAVPAPREHI